MKINEETTVSEEQVLFNTLRHEDQELVIKIMKSLLPCELNCEIEEEKKIPEKIDNSYYHLEQGEQNQLFKNKINDIIVYLDYLKSKGE